ncbi:potassium channel family protein [Rothia terrae]|uniref:Trk system potassium uptake protein TrkA n=1 Tax=Rothia terrae TaxID=396015 RepID=A0A7H2BBK2_9MICC|nr:TrkA family potassium uptake protein [Rothia terrae]MDT0190213.1 TrkA family potassium uptake protein [Rothia terrae]QNV37048.1 TrkA family potassium uptake protein [Rothia terrae]
MQVIIIGSGSVGSSIARELLSHGHKVTIIDEKPEVIGRSPDIKNAHWLIGDACELSVLKQSHPETCDVIVAATGDDKSNLVVSLMARSEFGVPRTVARVNNPKNEWLFDDSWGVDVAVSTPRLMTALVEEAVEVGDVVRLLTLQTGGAMLVEYTVPMDHPIIGHTVDNVQWPAETTLTAILRDGTPITPTGDDVIEGEDELFFITTPEGEEDIRLLFS